MIRNLNNYQEVLLVGSGKGVTPVDSIEELNWKKKSTFYSRKINKIYNKLII